MGIVSKEKQKALTDLSRKDVEFILVKLRNFMHKSKYLRKYLL
jgi:hypothetical protein